MTKALQYIKDKAEERSYVAAIANARSYDYEISKMQLTNGEICCLIERSGSISVPKEGQSFNGDVQHAVQITMFRKFEDATLSSIAETYDQKYTARLEDILSEAIAFIFSMNCNNIFDITVNSIDEVLNQRVASMDGYQIQLTLRAWNQWE
jgi:hypothetical protein